MTVPFTVEVKVNNLNIRAEPTTSGKIKGQTGKGIFTIVEQKGEWGKLKSGAGWIYLGNKDYCTLNKSSDVDNSQLKKQLVACLNDIEKLTSFKKLKEML